MDKTWDGGQSVFLDFFENDSLKKELINRTIIQSLLHNKIRVENYFAKWPKALSSNNSNKSFSVKDKINLKNVRALQTNLRIEIKAKALPIKQDNFSILTTNQQFPPEAPITLTKELIIGAHTFSETIAKEDLKSFPIGSIGYIKSSGNRVIALYKDERVLYYFSDIENFSLKFLTKPLNVIITTLIENKINKIFELSIEACSPEDFVLLFKFYYYYIWNRTFPIVKTNYKDSLYHHLEYKTQL